MRIKKGFVLREIGGEMVAVATGEAAEEFRGMVQLNSVAAFIWECLQEDMTREEVLRRLLEKYAIDEETAGRDLDSVLERLGESGILER